MKDQKTKQPEINKMLDKAYEAGKDCAANGSDTVNCHFSFFSSAENTEAWENGYNDKKKEAATIVPDKKYKYITMVLVDQKPKTGVYRVDNNRNGQELGIIKWFPGWRQYCYFPSCPAVYSKGCLEDINEFMESLRNQRMNK